MSITIDHKESRYDRQRRLWGDAGQSNIESAKLLLLNANATGAEILKNLVLPGVGTFTIVDDKRVTARDLGTNFFVTQDSLGSSRAQIVTSNLKELNPYVKGDYLEESPSNLIHNRPDYFNTYSLVIAANLDDEKTVRELAKICWDREIPLLLALSYGLIGYIRLVLKEHEIVESKLDNPIDDLRVSNPWPELLHFCTEHPVSTLVDSAHSHTPYLCLLVEFLQRWKSQHNGAEPKTRDEKNQFKKMFVDAMKEPEEPNFVEAVSAAFKAFNRSGVPPSIQDILNDDKCVNINEKSSSFWILANATKKFVDNEGKGELPLAGSIPDMHSDTERYIKLQNLFNEKAEQDAQTVKKYVEENLKRFNRNENEISYELVKTFCKNSHNLRVIRSRSLEQEYDPKTANTTEFNNSINTQAAIVFYLLLRACDRFYKTHQYYPGEKIEQPMEDDVSTLTTEVTSLLSELSVNGTVQPEYIQEMVHFGGSELHNIAAFIGGVASQEVIKVITRQRIPLNNTFIFVGVNSVAMQFSA